MKNIRKLTLSGIFIALGVALSPYSIPIGASKCFPVQHLINVISAVLLGPIYAVFNAFAISLLRNILGLGTLLAFPGSIFGALLASLLYKRWHNYRLSVFGEIVGTGLIGGVAAFFVATFMMGKEVGAFFFVVPFLISTGVGSLIALMILEVSALQRAIRQRSQNES